MNVALAVSIGCGVYPAETLGKVDAQQFLYFGKHWLKAGFQIRQRAKNLLSLLTTAVCFFIEQKQVLYITRSRVMLIKHFLLNIGTIVMSPLL